MLKAKQETGRILIFKDAGNPKMRLTAELEKSAATRLFRTVTATDQSRLRQLLETGHIDAVVIDVGRETGNTLTTLRILEGFPSTPIFVFNSFMLPRILDKVREYDHIHYSENSSDMTEFISSILEAVANKKQCQPHSLSLAGLLQLMKKEKWSGQLKIMARKNSGILSLQHGRLVSAAAGRMTGQAAWEKMAAWEKITVETSSQLLPLCLRSAKAPSTFREKDRSEAGCTDPGNIDMLHLVQLDRKITLNLNSLNRAVEELRAVLSTSLLRTDIFLTGNGRALAGWNSHPFACSAFALITKSLKSSLQNSHFPDLGAYYLLDLADDQVVLMVITAELQWGFLLTGIKERLGLLLNIILPKALKALTESQTVENTAQETPWESFC